VPGDIPLEFFGIAPFADTPLWAIGLTALAHFGGFLIRGAFGFGSNLPIVMATTLLLGPHHAIILTILTASFSQVHLFPQGVRRADWRLVFALIVGVYLGIAIGTYVFASLSPAALAPILGALVIVIVIMDRTNAIQRLGRLTDLRARPTVASLSVISGFVGTVSGGGGIYFLAPFLKHMCPTPDGFRSTSLVLSGLFMLGRVTFIAIAGFFDSQLVAEAVLLLPAVLLGGWAGTRWFHWADPSKFFAGLSAMLTLGALLLIAKGVFG